MSKARFETLMTELFIAETRIAMRECLSDVECRAARVVRVVEMQASRPIAIKGSLVTGEVL